MLCLSNSWRSPLIYQRIKVHDGFAEGRVRPTRDLLSHVDLLPSSQAWVLHNGFRNAL